MFALCDARCLDRADVAAASEIRLGTGGCRTRAHDHFLRRLQQAVNVEVAAIPSVRGGGEAGVAALVDAQDAVVGCLLAGEVLSAHDGIAGDDPRIVAHVVDDPVRRESECTVEGARVRRAGGRAHEGIGIRGGRAAGELELADLLDVVHSGEVDGAAERRRARASVGNLRNGEGVCARERNGPRRVEGDLADGRCGIDGDFSRVVHDQLVGGGERAGGRGRPVRGGGEASARAADPRVGVSDIGARDERAGLVVRQKVAVDHIIDAESIVRKALGGYEVEAERAARIA